MPSLTLNPSHPQVELNLQEISHHGEEGEETAPFSPRIVSGIAAQSWQSWFQTWLTALQAHLPPASAYELSLRLTGDREIQGLNAQFRHQDRPTDVLAFAALELDSPHLQALQPSLPLELGDIVISVETAHRQAKELGHALPLELTWLASHGLLHLLGWDHPDEAHLHQMWAKQTQLLQRIGFTYPDHGPVPKGGYPIQTSATGLVYDMDS